jgi:hypothetical protein
MFSPTWFALDFPNRIPCNRFSPTSALQIVGLHTDNGLKLGDLPTKLKFNCIEIHLFVSLSQLRPAAVEREWKE